MDSQNPLLQPIHGVSLQDYSAGTAKIASGTSADDVCKALGIEAPVWDEANTLWVKRMQEDSSFAVTTLFGQYFGKAGSHPKLGKLGAAALAGNGQANLQRLKEDRYFYHELEGARSAAYAAGLDGAQWVLDEFGIPLGEFQGAAMQWMQQNNREMAADGGTTMNHFMEYQREKQAEYAAKFAEQNGGNIADDIHF